MRKAALIVAIISTLSGQAQYPSKREIIPNLSEHCFEISDNIKIAMRPETTTPHEFLREPRNAGVEAAINGTYFGGENPQEYNSQGIAYLADGHQFADGHLGYVRGYFTVSKNRGIKVGKTLDRKLSEYWLVVGTHPLLVVDGEVHAQASEPRYNRLGAYRSAIGTRDGKICFAVSEDSIEMKEWAERLQKAGYLGAINLDGGPISQLAERKDSKIEVKGKGNSPTRLVIFEYKK